MVFPVIFIFAASFHIDLLSQFRKILPEMNFLNINYQIHMTITLDRMLFSSQKFNILGQGEGGKYACTISGGKGV